MKINTSAQTKVNKYPMIISHRTSRIKGPIFDYFFNAMKNRKIIFEHNNNLKYKKNWKNNNTAIMNVINMKLNLSNNTIEQKNNDILPKLSPVNPYNYKYFCKDGNKIALYKSLSTPDIKSMKKKGTNLESNVMKLQKESNIYTANASYIKNKKLIVFDKYLYDNNRYKFDRLKLLDMSFPKVLLGKGISGKIYYNHNKFNRLKIKEKDYENEKI